MDAPSAQLHQETRAAVMKGLSSRRPLLHHLSADTAWLLQIPRPQHATRRGGRLYFNILIDPWLSGTQTDVSSWLSKQWHAVTPRVPSIAAVEDLIRESELTAAASTSPESSESRVQDGESDGECKTLIDLVAISHEFTDHCHQETMLQVHQDVPVLATEVSKRSSNPPTASAHADDLKQESSTANTILGSLSLGSDDTELLKRRRLARYFGTATAGMVRHITPGHEQRSGLLSFRSAHRIQ